jgi:hypothetical protein
LVLALFLALYKDIKVSKYVTSELYVIIGDETGLDILQLQNTTSSNHVKLPKKYVKSTLKFYYENLINNKLSKLDQKFELVVFWSCKISRPVSSIILFVHENHV